MTDDPTNAVASGHISPLISVEEVLAQSDAKIFDVRGTWGNPPRSQYDAYLSGHIPGAAFLDWTKSFVEQGVPLNLASVSDKIGAAQSFGALGINTDDLVVLYDDYHHMFAGRIWWAMRYWGFQNVRVLNGGWRYWTAAGHAVSTKEVHTKDGGFQPARTPEWLVDLDAFIQSKDSASVMDGRGAAGYAGNPKDPRSGHIPGAISVPYNTLLDRQSGRFLEDAALVQIFDTAIPNWRTSPVISSCGSGYSGTVPMLALAHLGVRSSLFDGSIAVWKQDLSRPLAQGMNP